MGDTSQDDGKHSNSLEESNAGILPRLIDQLFVELKKLDPEIELTVRCSVVELYLDRLRDLLHEPSLVRPKAASGRLVGCATLSCLDTDDIKQIVRRAQSVRTASAADPNQDSSRSSMIVQILVEQSDSRNETNKQSQLLIVDMADSELSAVEGEATSEPGLLSKSLQALHQQIKDVHRRQQLQNEQNPSQLDPKYPPPSVRPDLPMIAQILNNSFGGSANTSVILTASPSEALVKQAVNTIQFGLDCRKVLNRPLVNLHFQWQECRERITDLTSRQDRLEDLTKALAIECLRLSGKGSRKPTDRALLDACEQIQACISEQRDIDFVVESKTEHEGRLEFMRLRSEFRRVEELQEEALAREAQVQSDLAIAQAQLEALQMTCAKQKKELNALKLENIQLKQRKHEVEHNLRTSLFRESEAVVFLRQFRKFYYRLLKKTAEEGNGSFNKVISKIPGAADLSELVDFDKLMMESGLLEEGEVGIDSTVKQYRPSKDALLRSSAEAEKAESERENDTHCGSGKNELPGESKTPISYTLSILKRHETGEATEARQRIYSTPSGRCVDMRENILENELLRVSEQCASLKKELEAEKAIANALKSTAGGSGQDILKSVEEIKSLQDTIERRENDVKTFISKMNELHISAKTLKEKVQNREQHAQYLEDQLVSIETMNAMLATDRDELEASLRAEVSTLQQKISGIAKPVWQQTYGEHASRPPFQSRLVLPFCNASEGPAGSHRRNSVGEKEPAIDLDAIAEYRFFIATAFPRESQPSGQAEAFSTTMNGPSKSQEEPLSHHAASRSLSATDYFFMDDDSFAAADMKSGHQSMVGGLLDAYNSTSQTNLDVGNNLSFLTDDELSTSPSGRKPSGTLKNKFQTKTSPATSSPRRGSSFKSNLLQEKFGLSMPNVAVSSPKIAAAKKWVPRSSAPATAGPIEAETSASSLSASASYIAAMNSSGSGFNKVVSSQAHDSMTDEAAVEKSTEEVTGQGGLHQITESVSITEAGSDQADAPGVHKVTQLNPASKAPFEQKVAEVPIVKGKQRPLGDFMSKLRAQAAKQIDVNDDEQSVTPEWLKKFRTIGAKNAQEKVIEAQGKAPAAELTRAAFGETLRHADRSAEPKVLATAATGKWVPKKKKKSEDDDDGSDSDDSFARNFIRGAGSSHVPSQPSLHEATVAKSVDQDESDDSEKEEKIEMADPGEKGANIASNDSFNAPSIHSLSRGSNHVDGKDTSLTQVEPPSPHVKFANKNDSIIGVASFVDNTSWPTVDRTKSPWEGNSDDEKDDEPRVQAENNMSTVSEHRDKAFSDQSPIEKSNATNWESRLNSTGKDSTHSAPDKGGPAPLVVGSVSSRTLPVTTSDSDSSDEELEKKTGISPSGSSHASALKHHSDSDDSSDDEPRTPAWKQSASSSQSSGGPARSATNSLSALSKATPLTSRTALEDASVVVFKKPTVDKESDESSHDDREETKKPAVAPRTFAGKSRTSLDSDDSSDEDQPPKASISTMSKSATPIPKSAESDSSSDEDSTTKPISRSGALGAEKHCGSSDDEESPSASAAPTPGYQQETSDSDKQAITRTTSASQVSDDESSVDEVPKPLAEPARKPKDSDTDDSSDEEPSPPPTRPSKSADPASDDSSDGEVNAGSVAPMVPVKPLPSQTADSDESSSSDEEPIKLASISKPVAPLPSSKTDDDSTDGTDGDDESDESEKKPKNVQSKQSSASRKSSKKSSASATSSKQQMQSGTRGSIPRSMGSFHSEISESRSASRGPESRNQNFQNNSSLHDDTEDEASDLDGSHSRLGSTRPNRSTDPSPAPTNGKKDKKEKAKFVIKNGKLVKSESFGDDPPVTAITRKKEKAELTMQPKNPAGSMRKARSGVKPAVPSTPTTVTDNKKSPFTIKDGKLVQTPPVAAVSPAPPPPPAFSIVNGMLVKNEEPMMDATTEKKVKKKKKAGDASAKKSKEGDKKVKDKTTKTKKKKKA